VPTAPLAPVVAPAPRAANPPIAHTALRAPAPVAVPTPAAPAAVPPTPHRAPVAVAGVADPASDEQRLVAAAVRALRHEHDPARAAQLLARYLERYPDGAAAEDALALALEATLGRDPPRAAGFATRYLARYPAGRWSSLARRALEP
jgi:TolA-binding protein